MSKLLDWIHSTIGVDRRFGPEIQTHCPRCGFDRFYFNLNKKIGWCHRASCQWAPTLQDLIAVVGFGPDQEGFFRQKVFEPPRLPVALPERVAPVLFFDEAGRLSTWDQAAYEYLRGRGVEDQVIMGFDIQVLNSRVYLPVRENSELLSYVSRNIHKKGYLYPPGGRHSETFLGWEEVRLWKEVLLVENSFVSLALRKIHCTTNFGSHLSDAQVDKIQRSNARAVVLMWDEGAEMAAQRTVARLRQRGVPALYLQITGQPDDYELSWVEQAFGMGCTAVRQRKPFLDLRRTG